MRDCGDWRRLGGGRGPSFSPDVHFFCNANAAPRTSGWRNQHVEHVQPRDVHEIAAGIYRLSTSVPPSVVPGGFTFNQFLLVDDEPLLFHAGMRRLFPSVRAAVARVIDPAKLALDRLLSRRG